MKSKWQQTREEGVFLDHIIVHVIDNESRSERTVECRLEPSRSQKKL